MQDITNGRCGWCGTDELYVKYHDQEWGKLVTDDKTLFEFLVLESAQAGLSWITILRKREGYRKAFYNFDAELVAQMTDEDIERLMQFEGIVKNRLKIKSTITNAKLFLAVQKEFGSFYKVLSKILCKCKTGFSYKFSYIWILFSNISINWFIINPQFEIGIVHFFSISISERYTVFFYGIVRRE